MMGRGKGVEGIVAVRVRRLQGRFVKYLFIPAYGVGEQLMVLS